MYIITFDKRQQVINLGYRYHNQNIRYNGYCYFSSSLSSEIFGFGKSMSIPIDA